MRAELADGRVLEFPDGTDPAVVQATVKKVIAGPGPSAAERVANDPITQGAKNFTQDEGNYLGLKIPSSAANTMAGFYKGARDLGTGLNQLTLPVEDLISPRGPTLSGLVTGQQPLSRVEEARQKVAEQRKRDAPLMETGAGRAGELAFNVASVVPTLAVPGVNTVRGAAALGGAMGLLQPSESGKETLLNTGVGTALGGAGQAVANKLVSATAPVVRNARDAILAKAQSLGFVVSPSEGRGTVVNKLVTGLGNKQQTAQEASIRNAGAVEKIAKADLGLPEAEALTPEAFQAVRQQAYQQGYKPVESLNIVRSDADFEKAIGALAGKESQGAVTRAGQGEINDLTKELQRGQWTGKGLVDDIRTLREEGNANRGAIKDIGKQQLGRAQLEAARALEDLAERNLALNQAPADLIQNFRASRATIAKAHTIEDAMQGTSEINPLKLAKNETDAKKLSPDMYAAWKFAREFPKSNQLPSKVGGIPWNTAIQSSALGALGYGASEASGHGPAGAALAAVPLVRGPARSIALSKAYQGAMVNPATAVTPRLAALANRPARALQRIAPQIGAVTAMEID